MSIVTAVRDFLTSYPVADGLFRRLIWSRIHFPEVEMRFLQSLPVGSVDVAIDVGAAHGSYAWILNRKARKVYAFEPGVEHASYLQRCVWGTRVELVRAAVGKTCGQVSMYTPGKSVEALHSATLAAANPIVRGSETHIRQVEQVSLDSYFVDKLDVGRRLDILKVDVEGYELQVLEGAEALLKRHHPLIFCEIEARHNAQYPHVFSFLRQIGYRCYIYRNGDFEAFESKNIEWLQTSEDLLRRLSREYNPKQNSYINNFIFQHANSRNKVK